MITFKQFITEEQTHELRDYLFEHCSQFIKESMHSGLLTRGVKGLHVAEYIEFQENGEEVQAAIKQVRDDRKPLDSRRRIHDEADVWFKEHFGFNARSNAMFCFGWKVDRADVKAYGQPCYVIPIGPFEYVWSRKVEDFLVSVSDMEDDGYTSVTDMLDHANYKNNDLVEAINSKREIMLKCEKYLAFPVEYEAALKRALHIG